MRLVVTALVVAALVAVGVLHTRYDEQRRRADALTARVVELERALAARARVAVVAPSAGSDVAANPTPREGPSPVAGVRSIDRAAAPPDAALPPPIDLAQMQRDRERLRALWRDPEYRRAMLEQGRLGVQSLYGDLPRELGLSAEDGERLITLIAEQRLPDPERMPPWTTGARPEPAELKAWQAQMQERMAAQQQALRELLGDDGMKKFEQYQQTVPARAQTKAYRDGLASAGVPLTPEQERGLIDLLAAEQQRAMAASAPYARVADAGPGAARPASPLVAPSGVVVDLAGAVRAPAAASPADLQAKLLRAQEESNRRFREAAASLLTPEQLERVMRQRDAQLAMQRASLRALQAGASTVNQ